MSTTAVATMTSSGSAAASSTPTATCSNLSQIPIAEAGCAVSFSDGHKDAMAACCKSADVISYFDDCGLFCVAAGQSVNDLRNCLYGQKATYQDVFCNAPDKATATNTSPDLPASASASVVNGSDDNDDDDNDNDDGDGDDKDGDEESAPEDEGSAAPRLTPGMGVSKTGLTISALLLSAVAFGALQI